MERTGIMSDIWTRYYNSSEDKRNATGKKNCKSFLKSVDGQNLIS